MNLKSRTSRLLTNWYTIYAAALIAGAYVRLDQFLTQVLIDDEWHAIHQLLRSSGPRDIALSFGHADYSIPLTLFYWCEASLFGLSELTMRFPMMVFGGLLLALFPLYVRQVAGDRASAVYAFLLAFSPLLIIYSRTARPYAITLVLAYVAHWAFYQYWDRHRWRALFGTLYGVCATLATWLHPIAGPFVIAPFVVEGVAALATTRREGLDRLCRLMALGAPTAVGMAVSILPPLLNDPVAMASKTGVDLPTWETLLGIWFVWFGTASGVVLVACLTIAAFGLPELWRKFRVTRSALTGLALTSILIGVSQPAWIQHPLTLGRYLLPALPLVLLSLALGTAMLVDTLAGFKRKLGTVLRTAVLAAPIIALAASSPLPKLLRQPNTNTMHSIFQFDFRRQWNFIADYQELIPLSPFWSKLAALPPNTLRIAAAPWYFESYNWDAARWESIGRQPVLPAYLSGLCMEKRAGEVPNDNRFHFRNAVYPGQIGDMNAKEIDLLVFQKPYRRIVDDRSTIIGEETLRCEAFFRATYGAPWYEDDWIVVFAVSKKAESLIDA